MQELPAQAVSWLAAHPAAAEWYTAVVRLVLPVLSALILLRAVRSLLRVPHTPEVWGQLSLPNGKAAFLCTHWEKILGRRQPGGHSA